MKCAQFLLGFEYGYSTQSVEVEIVHHDTVNNEFDIRLPPGYDIELNAGIVDEHGVRKGVCADFVYPIKG